MKTITQDSTSLHEFGLTLDLILSGEKCEFDPETKVNARKEKYVLHEFATRLVDAYADDLLAAYRAVEELEAENERLAGELADTASAAEKAGGQLNKVLAGEKEFAGAEKLLAKFEQQLETLIKDKKVDKTTIENLKGQVAELAELRETVPQLEAEVNEVLDNLRSYFEDEGIEIPDYDGEYDDDYVE